MPLTYAQLLRQNASFRRVWMGQVVSFFGDWFKTIALYTAVQELTDSAQALAAVLVFNLLPIFLMTPIAGPLADRVDRRKLMIGTDIARAIGALLLIGAHQLGSLALIFAVQFVMVSFSGIFIPARSAVIPQITNAEELPVAMALSGGTWSVMLALGAAAGGVVTALVGVDWALLLDGFTYLLSGIILFGLSPQPPSDTPSDRESAGFWHGIRYLRARPYLTSVLSLKPMIGLATASVAMIPLFGGGMFPAAVGPMFIGLLYTARGTGALFGAMGVRRLTGDDPAVLRRCIPFGFLLSALAYVGLSKAGSIHTAALMYLVGTLGSGMVWVFAGILGQIASDREYRGRVFSLEFGMMTLVSSIVSLIAGALVDHTDLGPRDVVAGLGGVMVLPALLWWAAMGVLKPSGDGKVPPK
ncbi:MAG: MFS family permease [Myxococcota bacterium]